jgi:Effector-associated domain 11/C-terminal of Roc, COR, domain
LSEGVYIAPQLLDNQPPTYPKNASSESVLKFRLTYDFMPKGILSRFSVREHAAIARNADQQQVIWSKGVLLAIQDCYVEVLERDYDIEGSIEIAVHGDGFQAKKVLFQVVESLKVVNKRWWHQVKQEVPCCCKRCRPSDKPHFFQLSYLDERLKVGKAQVECMITPFEAVEIKAVLAGVMETEEVQARLRSNPSFAKRFRMEDFKKLMSKNKLEDAIQLFDSDGFIDHDEKNRIIQFKRQLHSLKKEAQLGKLSHSDFAREESKIADACLGWVNDLEGE